MITGGATALSHVDTGRISTLAAILLGIAIVAVIVLLGVVALALAAPSLGPSTIPPRILGRNSPGLAVTKQDEKVKALVDKNEVLLRKIRRTNIAFVVVLVYLILATAITIATGGVHSSKSPSKVVVVVHNERGQEGKPGAEGKP